jgi:hypothetical protein
MSYRTKNSIGFDAGPVHVWLSNEAGKKSRPYTSGRMSIWKLNGGNTLLSGEWNLGRAAWHGGIGVHLCREDHPDIQIRFGLPFLFFVYLSFGHFPTWLRNRIVHEWSGRDTEISLSFLEGIGNPWVFMHLWYAEGISSHSGFSKCFSLTDVIFGSAKHSSIERSKHVGFVRLPEQTYQVEVTLTTDTWKRPRWPWPAVIDRAHIDCGKDGIPDHAGKGENDYDLDDDSVFSSTAPVTKGLIDISQVEEACQALAKSIIRNRQRYGQPDAAMKSLIQRNIVEY